MSKSVRRKAARRTEGINTEVGVLLFDHFLLSIADLQKTDPERLIQYLLPHPASKTLAEQAFWKFFDEQKPSFDGCTINPPLVRLFDLSSRFV